MQLKLYLQVNIYPQKIKIEKQLNNKNVENNNVMCRILKKQNNKIKNKINRKQKIRTNKKIQQVCYRYNQFLKVSCAQVTSAQSA